MGDLEEEKAPTTLENDGEGEVLLWPRTLQSSQKIMARRLSFVQAREVVPSVRHRPLRDLGRGYATPDMSAQHVYGRLEQQRDPKKELSLPSLNAAKARLRALAEPRLLEQKPTKTLLAQVDEDRELSPLVSKPEGGTSTVAQAVLNMTNVLLGSGLLALPYAAKCTGGYLGAMVAILLGSGATLFTAKILGRELRRFGARGFPDLALYTFGSRGRVLVALLLYLDIFMCLVLFIIMGSTNLSAIAQAIFRPRKEEGTEEVEALVDWFLFSPKGSAWIIAVMLLPATVFDDLSTLSKFSAVGTVATVSLVVVVTVSAVVVPDAAAAGASSDFASRALPIGLVLYCFAGHALFPSIYFSLENPERDWDRVVDISYLIVCSCCVIVACAGYSLFGDSVSDQISVDLEQIDRTTGIVCCGLIAVSALSKFALELQPIAYGIEELIALLKQGPLQRSLTTGFSEGVGLRLFILGCALLCAVSLPAFAVVDSLLGAVFSTLISIVFPCAVTLHQNSDTSPLYKATAIITILGGIIAGGLGTYGAYVEALR